jgi:hypothetical protein
MTTLTLGQRIYLGAVAVLALWVGIWCYFVPSRSEVAIPWGVPTLCATFLGSMYLSGMSATGTSMCARRWVDVRVVMPLIATWTGGLTIISLFYLPVFDFSRTQVWIWFGAYILYPLIALGLLWTHRRERNVHPMDEPEVPEWARRLLRIQGSLMVVLGVALLLAPDTMKILWPWQTGRLMLQLYSAPMLTYGIGSFLFARQPAWSEIRLGLLATGVFTGAELAVTIYHLPLFDGHPVAIVVWILWLAATTCTSALLVRSAFARTAQDVSSDLAAEPEMKLTRTA